MATMSLGGAQIGHQGAPLDCKRSFFSVRVNLGERSELFWLRAIASLAEVIAPLSVSEAERARLLVFRYHGRNARYSNRPIPIPSWMHCSCRP